MAPFTALCNDCTFKTKFWNKSTDKAIHTIVFHFCHQTVSVFLEIFQKPYLLEVFRTHFMHGTDMKNKKMKESTKLFVNF